MEKVYITLFMTANTIYKGILIEVTVSEWIILHEVTSYFVKEYITSYILLMRKVIYYIT